MASGHGESVMRWPLKRLMIFSWLASKRRRREMVEDMNAFRLAMHADKKQFQRATKDG
ncbi:hypothetical protein LCGC14_0631280 [marine sediment metagenome]|uniref:Uncharacterized protein n=1 Tax=marine sediment metagenome TaxID=412755 RepID=A0A0F9UAD1_9ZZZZ